MFYIHINWSVLSLLIFLVFFCNFMKKRSQNIRNIRTDDILYFPSRAHILRNVNIKRSPQAKHLQKNWHCVLSWYLWSSALHHTDGWYKTILCNLHNNFCSVLFVWWWHLVYMQHAELKPYNIKKTWLWLMVIIQLCILLSSCVSYYPAVYLIIQLCIL